jgi:precorrin-2 dehydrogenase/sirohydrochlorin ferrochelatase
MANLYYPAMLDIKNKNCLVVGGGHIALRKCMALLECEASVKVVSLEFIKEFYDLAPARISLIRDVFQTKYMEDCFLVIAATGECEANQNIYRYCEENHILVNVADEPEHCSFIAPAYFRRGDLTVSISTGGKSPALAKKIKEEIASNFPAEYAQHIEKIGLLRQEIMKKNYSPKERAQILTKLSELSPDELSDFYENIRGVAEQKYT